MPIYETARNKVTWADHHISNIETRIDALKKCLVVTSHINPKTQCEFIKCDFKEPQKTFVDELALRLGDSIHNLHCALDHAWFQTITRLIPSGDWERTKFPIYPTPDGLEKALRKAKIDLFTPNFFKFILRDIQPHDGGNYAIRPLHKLNIRDKHSLVIPVVHYSSIGNIYLKDKQGVVIKADTWGTIDPLPHYVEFERDLHVEDPGNATFEIMFEQGDAGNHMGMIETLRFYSHHVLLIVELLEKFEE